MRRALVTGATGLVGSHIVDRLLGRRLGRSARSSRDTVAELTTLGVESARGDILDADAFARAAADCDVHLPPAAAITPRGGWEAYRRPNVDGTRNAIAAAERSGARCCR